MVPQQVNLAFYQAQVSLSGRRIRSRSVPAEQFVPLRESADPHANSSRNALQKFRDNKLEERERERLGLVIIILWTGEQILHTVKLGKLISVALASGSTLNR